MQKLGFREKSQRYRQCSRRYGLSGDDHLSVYSWSEQLLPDAGRLVEMTEFHVTFYRGGEHLHFYFHEMHDNHWQPVGHTSGNEILRLGLEVETLRTQANAVAGEWVAALGGVILPREAVGESV